jgi:outer membrane protein OmpA-like peptidoglycan-associated protein
MAGQRDLLNRKRDRVMRSMTDPSADGRSDTIRRIWLAGSGQGAEERAVEQTLENGGDGPLTWTNQDFINIRTRLDSLERQRQDMLSGRTAAASEEMDCFRIYFDQEDCDIRGQKDVLDRAVRAIVQSQAGEIVIIGHTDRHGGYNENMNLGAMRAIAVKNMLVIRGVPEYRIECVSAGHTRPRLASDPMAESADIMNRRAEITIRS